VSGADQPPCLFNPVHGPAAAEVGWAPGGGARRRVPRDVLAMLADAYNRHDLDAVRALYAPGATVDDSTVDAAIATHERFFAFLPDVKIDLRAAAAEGAVVIAELTLRGTNTGPVPLGPVHRAIVGIDAELVPPTGRAVAVPVVLVIEVDGGRIVTERQHMDSLTLLAQLGLLPTA
jgi:predicted ester cyclase